MFLKLPIYETEFEMLYLLSHPYLHPLKKTQLCSPDTLTLRISLRGGGEGGAWGTTVELFTITKQKIK